MRERSALSSAGVSSVVVALCLAAASCSALGIADDVAEPAPLPEENVVSAPTSVVSPPLGDVDDEDEETVDDLEVEWAAQRARVVESLSSENYGVGEDNILRGPGLFEIDLDDCPQGWNNASGFDDTTIRIGLIGPQSGEFASFGQVMQGMQAYFDWVNARGGINGRLIQLVARDDVYDAGVAQAAVNDLIATGDPFYVTNIGSPGALAVYDQLNEQCIPQPFVVSAHPAWGDPQKHPFTSGFELSYTTEALLWGTWIKNNLGSQVPVTVSALVIDNDFGQLYADAFQEWASDNPDVVSQVTFVRHPPGAIDVAPEMQKIAQADAQVFLSMTTGRPCQSVVKEADALGITDAALAYFTPSVCKEPSSNMVPLGPAGDGFRVVGGGVKSASDQQFADETFIKFVHTQLAEAGLDAERPLVSLGFAQYGWAHVELLRLATEMPGGLSRSSIALVLRNLELRHPMLFEGVHFTTSGTRDGYLIEGAEFSRYDAASQAWIQQGMTIDLNGSSPNCIWVQLICTH